jgi:hypothetical protein
VNEHLFSLPGTHSAHRGRRFRRGGNCGIKCGRICQRYVRRRLARKFVRYGERGVRLDGVIGQIVRVLFFQHSK